MHLAPVLKPLIVWTQNHSFFLLIARLFSFSYVYFHNFYFLSFFPLWYCSGERNSCMWRPVFSFRWQKSNGNCYVPQ